MTIHARIRERRRHLMLSQSELGKLLNISSQCISNWETGKDGPKRARIQEVAETLLTTPEYLLFGQANTNKKISKLQKHELLDRIHCINEMFHSLVADHAAADLIRDKIDAAGKMLGTLYQDAGEISFKDQS